MRFWSEDLLNEFINCRDDAKRLKAPPKSTRSSDEMARGRPNDRQKYWQGGLSESLALAAALRAQRGLVDRAQACPMG